MEEYALDDFLGIVDGEQLKLILKRREERKQAEKDARREKDRVRKQLERLKKPIKKEEPKEEKKSDNKKTFMEFVKLTEDEHSKLVSKFGNTKANELIKRLNDYIGQIGVNSASKKYKSHYHTILNRNNRDGGEKKDYAREEALRRQRERVQKEILQSNQKQNAESIQQASYNRRQEMFG